MSIVEKKNSGIIFRQEAQVSKTINHYKFKFTYLKVFRAGLGAYVFLTLNYSISNSILFAF